MKQVVQNFRSGDLWVEDIPGPPARPQGLLVRTVASAVSAGTEKSKVEVARKNLVGKALSRPDQVQKVLDTLRKEGVKATFNKVRNKLDALSPLGYSAAGHVIAVGEGCEGFRVGDAVACAGAGYANHAELIWVPQNLCARVPEGVALEDAAFATLGAIALQGVRQAEATFGETVAVIGLGLLGQLTLQLLRASGCRLIGVDVDESKVMIAKQHGFANVLARTADIAGHVRALTDGNGVDAVIITAGAPNNDPIVLAGEIARDRAHVVVVGAVPLEVPRSPYYEKELDVRLSRSYGPGRYDRGYEEKGHDYPIGYVRWTENRNMQAFLGAVRDGQVRLKELITHRFPIESAEAAYDLIAGETQESFLGVVLSYPTDQSPPQARETAPTTATRHRGNVGFIGAGSFAGGTLIPALKANRDVTLSKVCTATGLTARDIATRHGFSAAVESPSEILNDPAIDVVFIATRHDTHADLTARALSAGKSVFVEKPLALTREQLELVVGAASSNTRLLVGFNRRFSPHTAFAKSALEKVHGATTITIRVNAGPIAADSWIHDVAVGGGRLLGECCHFIDLAQALAGAAITRVHTSALGLPDPASRLRDNFVIALEFGDGSVATILYTSKGDVSSGKERVEIFRGGTTVVIDDFQNTSVWHRGKQRRLRTTQDKGHAEQLKAFVRSALDDQPMPISIDELRISSVATIAAAESLATGGPVTLF